MLVNVVIPSRLQSYEENGKSQLFLQRAIDSIAAQRKIPNLSYIISVGIDPDSRLPSLDAHGMPIIFCQASTRSQAAALNAAARAIIDRDYIAFLEDDDEWMPDFSEIALCRLAEFDFISSNQLETDTSGNVIRVNDFPTPSGWFMRNETWNRVGELNESYKWHLDNEWLGRLSIQPLKRAHLVECSAPIEVEIAAQIRPWLQNVVNLSGHKTVLIRHHLPLPLIKRCVHKNSGMAQIASKSEANLLSHQELRQLVESYGRIPW